MIDGPQANFSLPTIDRTLPQRTNFRVAAMERHQELLQFFREPTEISARTKLEAVEIDENAETNQTSGANNIRQLPSVEVREAAANAADEASDTNIIRPSLQLRIAGEMEISRRRNQHSYDLRLERIKELLVPGNVNDSDVCPICEGTYTVPLEALTNITERHMCANCYVEYTTIHIPVTLMTPVLCQIAYMSLADAVL
ncbi:hypothetical protein sscle_13g096170 [Sclerotinia sclerotiorum 1980 UF-70]|uniref:Uncharacterized protein n=1 Tax=Sclerotinia sclerotiorum (strain ATCC 18683 / 1980 / Ss-1) TaxID=665079 RepID=A0A1D9QIS2_SCLS1|nr:hypothetical protein sscle_13g096170 [Sclerotinia sclerotiorum 1980 UF-70]